MPENLINYELGIKDIDKTIKPSMQTATTIVSSIKVAQETSLNVIAFSTKNPGLKMVSRNMGFFGAGATSTLDVLGAKDEEGLTQAIGTNVMQNAAGLGLGMLLGSFSSGLLTPVGYQIGYTLSEPYADDIWDGMEEVLNNVPPVKNNAVNISAYQSIDDIADLPGKSNSSKLSYNEDNDQQAPLNSRKNSTSESYSYAFRSNLSPDKDSISRINKNEAASNKSQPQYSSNFFNTHQFSFEATKTAMANMSKISLKNQWSSEETFNTQKNSVATKSDITNEGNGDNRLANEPGNIAGISAIAVSVFSPIIAVGTVLGGVMSGIEIGFEAGSVSKGISTAFSSISKGFATIAKGFSGIFDSNRGRSDRHNETNSNGIGSKNSSVSSGGESGSVAETGGWGRPIIMDLDGDGVELVSHKDSNAYYDIDGDGTRNKIGWAGPDDGLLAYDIDGDKDISKRGEISFVDYVKGAKTDLEGLHYFDTNKDGQLDKNDKEFDKFNVWQDKNQNGVSDKGELLSLDQAGISSIGLTSDNKAEEVKGNHVYGYGEYTKKDGANLKFSDTALQYEKNNIKPSLQADTGNSSSVFKSIAYRDYSGLKSTSISNTISNTPFSDNNIEIFGS